MPFYKLIKKYFVSYNLHLYYFFKEIYILYNVLFIFILYLYVK